MSHATTCSISGLAIPGGTAVRCLLLTQSPYDEDSRFRSAWLVRTPPLRATYDGSGLVSDVHPEDVCVADLWLRGLREDLVERGTGDNTCHDAPARRDMSFEDLVESLRVGRVWVRQDRHFWRQPLDLDDALSGNEEYRARRAATATLQRIEAVLASDAELAGAYPDPVSRGAARGKFLVDEPVPYLVRVRHGDHEHGPGHLRALHAARAAVERAGFVAVVSGGSGRYSGDADLIVLPAPGQTSTRSGTGPQWDMAPGQDADRDKILRVTLAVVREDVWTALVRYPHDDGVHLDCDACGQQSCYHAEDLRCPTKSINGRAYKEHGQDARYTHGPVFPAGVEHVVEPRPDGETVWYGIAAFQHGTRTTWDDICTYFRDRDRPASDDPESASPGDAQIDRLFQELEERHAKEQARVAALPPAERAQIEAAQARRRATWEAEEERRQKRPHFGDFLISDAMAPDFQRPGAWIFRDTTPGVIRVSDHLSMYLADRAPVPSAVLDAIADLSAVSSILGWVGVPWRPTTAAGPQSPDWGHHTRFARTILQVAEAEFAESMDGDADDEGEEPKVRLATLSDAIARVGQRALRRGART